MTMKERDRARFAERQRVEREAAFLSTELAVSRHNSRRLAALMQNARLVYDYDRDFPGEFSAES